MKQRFIILTMLLIIISGIVNADDSDELLVKNLIEEGKYDELEIYMNSKMSTHNVNALDDILKKALIHMERNSEYKLRLKYINIFLNKYPDFPDKDYYYKQYGITSKMIYRYKDAASFLEKYISVAIDNFHFYLWEQLSEIYFTLGDYNKCLFFLEQTLKTESNLTSFTVPANIQLVEVYFAQGKMNKALDLINNKITKYKQNDDFKVYYLKFKIELAKYYMINEDWDEFNKVDNLPLFWNNHRTNYMYKLQRISKYRDSIIIDVYKSYSLCKYSKTIDKIESINQNKLSYKEKLLLATMKGVSEFWEGERERAKEYLKRAINKRNDLLDEASFYLALIYFDEGNYVQAQKSLDEFNKVGRKSDLYFEGKRLQARLDNRLK